MEAVRTPALVVALALGAPLKLASVPYGMASRW